MAASKTFAKPLPDYDALIVVFSDVEMGAGGPYDDFPHSGLLGDLLLSYLAGEAAEKPIHFVFNGDTFDLLKTPYLGTYPHHIGNETALGKMAAVVAAHPKFFDALTQILEHPSANKQAHFVVGNHDAELLFPRVQRFVQARCGAVEQLRFPGFALTIGPVYFEHGSQSDVLFRTNPDKLFIDSPQGPLLNVSWASIALLDLVIPLQPLLYFHDRLKPKARVMELIPEIKELLTGQAWRYWTRDFWWDFLRQKDPLLKINWSMIREMVRRITTGSVDVAFNKAWLTNTVERLPQELFVTGHLHKPGGELIGHKRIMQLGCFRDEYNLLDDGRAFQPILKPYCEVYLKGERIVQLVVREIEGPPPAGAPASIFDVVPKLRAMLDEMGDRSADEAERRKQEAAEAAERNHEAKG